LNYRLLQGGEDDVDRILTQSARGWGIDGAIRYNKLMLAVFDAVGSSPVLPGSLAVPNVNGVWSYHLRLGRRMVEAGQRVGRPRHIVVYRVAADGVVEIMGLAHDRMLLARAARQMQRKAGG
jgi:toxin ParE1/3/4